MINNTQNTGNFERRADKWWESRWAFVMAIAIPLISIMTVYGALQINDTKQADAIEALQAQLNLFQNGDFKDSQQRVTELTAAVNNLTIQVAQLNTIINERIPNRQGGK